MNRSSTPLWRTADGRALTPVRHALNLAAIAAAITGIGFLLNGRPDPWSYAIGLFVYVAVGRLFAGQAAQAEHDAPRVQQRLIRLSRPKARIVIGLAVVAFTLGAAGFLAVDGLERVLYAGMFLPMGLGNLAWGVGSLLPEGPRARLVRAATLPFGILMVLSMVAWVALEASGRL